MASASNDIPLSLVKFYHYKERELYTRMVINLQMDPTCAMDIIAFWLWQEENGHRNMIQSIFSLNDLNLTEVVTAAKKFIDAIRAEPQPNQVSHGFREKALEGIEFYINNVCRKAFDDLREKFEEDARLRKMELLIHQMNQVNINHINSPIINIKKSPYSSAISVGLGGFDSMSLPSRSIINQQPYVPHGEGTSTRIYRRDSAISTSNFGRAMLSTDYPVDTLLRNSPIIPQFLRPEIHTNSHYLIDSSSYPLHPQQWNIPREERTLFVTFSNGYPFSEDEVYNFFSRYYGGVESVEIEKTEDEKPPLFAHVVFYSLETVLRILDGKLKVKFIANGKHLWARRFYPKKNKDKEEK